MRHANINNRRYPLVTTESPAPTILVSSVSQETRETITVEDHGTALMTQRLHVISVLLVDDHTLMREGLRQLFELEQDIQVVGEAADGFEALNKTRQLQPDVVLMDINMPIIDGIAVTRQITTEFPYTAVIMLTMHHQDQQIVQAMKNGARGYVPKSASAQQVAEAIRAVHAGGMALAPGMTGAIVNEVRRLSDTNTGSRKLGMLSEKELEIVRYVATGMSNKEIAAQLSYSEKTVKNYLSIVFQKLHLRDRTQVAIFALRHGLIPDGWM
ncbi:MAG TPA: response regulator transcription factor [Ktedonobacteraceae bacterium]|nr:response regulator transcription factor [Ktedonobacteraceae bacterium]